MSLEEGPDETEIMATIKEYMRSQCLVHDLPDSTNRKKRH